MLDGLPNTTDEVHFAFDATTVLILGRCNRLRAPYTLTPAGEIRFQVAEQPAITCEDARAAAFESAVILALPLMGSAAILPNGDLELHGATRTLDLHDSGSVRPLVEATGT